MSHNELLAMLSLAGMFGLFCFGFPIAYTMLFAGLLFGFLGIGKLVFYLLTVQFYQVMSDTCLLYTSGGTPCAYPESPPLSCGPRSSP